ncbi:RDD family protein [Microbacterium sp. 1P10UB]|uniref:RDD family protein n=1 Tax=unclassified Microbacterium TaxID=2609290 RepID=UPI0039A23852
MTEPAAVTIAPISRRAIGYLIDAVIAAGLAIVLYGIVVVMATVAGADGMLGALLVGMPVASALLLAWFLVYTFMQSRSGSIGMRAQGLRLVRARDEAPLGFGRALLRNLVFGLACSIVVGYFTPLFDGSARFQGWHDRAAGALMTDARATGPGSVPARRGKAAPVTPVAPAASAAASSAPAAGTPAAPAPGRAAPAVPPLPPRTPVAEPRPASPVPPRPSTAAPDGAEPLIAFVPGITQDPAPRATPPVAPATPAASGTAVPQHPLGRGGDIAELDATVVGQRVAAEAPPAPAAPAASAPEVPAPPASAREVEPIEDTRISIPGHRLVFTWDDGTRVSVSRLTVFGRNPAPQEGAVIVPVRDETLSLSKTHFEAAAETSGGWIMDRHSTNGMTLVRDGQRIACPAGQRVPVRLGDAIEIGDRIVTIGGYA